MRRELSSLEDQVGGLVAHVERHERRRAKRATPDSTAEEPQRYRLTRRTSVAIRAARATGEPAHRRVA